jgi:hypothetical protein
MSEPVTCYMIEVNEADLCRLFLLLEHFSDLLDDDIRSTG